MVGPMLARSPKTPTLATKTAQIGQLVALRNNASTIVGQVLHHCNQWLISTKLGALGATLAQICSKSAHMLPKSAQVWPTKFGRWGSKLAPKLAGIGPNLVEFGPTLAQIGRVCFVTHRG